MYHTLDCLGLFKEQRLIRIKRYDPIYSATARSKCSLIDIPGIPSSAIPFFIDANTLVVLEITLNIVLIDAHSCARPQAAFICFRKTMGCNQSGPNLR